MGQKWVFRHWLEVAQKWVQSGFRGRFCEEKGPETHFGPTFGPLPANDEKPIFDPLLCQINCSPILALRDLRPNTTQLGNFPEVFCINFRDVNVFGALLLPLEVRPCQATLYQTNLEEPKHNNKDDLNKLNLFRDIRVQTISTKNPAELLFKISHRNFNI